MGCDCAGAIHWCQCVDRGSWWGRHPVPRPSLASVPRSISPLSHVHGFAHHAAAASGPRWGWLLCRHWLQRPAQGMD